MDPSNLAKSERSLMGWPVKRAVRLSVCFLFSPHTVRSVNSTIVQYHPTFFPTLSISVTSIHTHTHIHTQTHTRARVRIQTQPRVQNGISNASTEVVLAIWLQHDTSMAYSVIILQLLCRVMLSPISLLLFSSKHEHEYLKD